MGKICRFCLLCRVVAMDDGQAKVGAGLFKPATKVQSASDRHVRGDAEALAFR